MKYCIAFILTLFVGQVAFSQNTKDMSQDSTYKNWYYESREKLYQNIKKTKVDVVFFGNSITERGPWHELFSNYKIANRGIGGDNTFGMKARVANAVSCKPKKIFLMMGINDIGRGHATSWTLKNYEEIIKIIKEISPKTRIYIQSTLPLNEAKIQYDYQRGREQNIRALNDGIVQLAKKYKVQYVNVKEVLANDYELKSEYTNDGIHVNIDAYLAWAKYLKDKKYL
ncbi:MULTISPECIES: GDSL-type esterase/lipase family protein [Sphingobacterium]|uniref:GDSL family lipase n=1 Tax=Sphingobacterium litopenaei TaxID=2763500 RepID=A0ABR7YAE2_9SPHI|nr:MULTISPECIES: GDSL-type esterase/lipase family protein [Sphingobacterium]MBD1428254.1 GDSL family lipase [Sphingobacterium litopenaei]NGM72119.1 GDSL family lipase [Sphingobacterium sp. SGL-16]